MRAALAEIGDDAMTGANEGCGDTAAHVTGAQNPDRTHALSIDPKV
jgi:hypothetical protein